MGPQAKAILLDLAETGEELLGQSEFGTAIAREAAFKLGYLAASVEATGDPEAEGWSRWAAETVRAAPERAQWFRTQRE